MSSLVGFVGTRKAKNILFACLARMEYRGYDSAGIATTFSGKMYSYKFAGKLCGLKEYVDKNPSPGTIGLGHLRWASHGPATHKNAHPHLSEDGLVAVVHNGILENYKELKDKLKRRGNVFLSDTDSEVIAHVIAEHLTDGRDLFAAVAYSLPLFEGVYTLAVMSSLQSNVLIGACQGNKLVIAQSAQGTFLISDHSALPDGVEKKAFVESYQLCTVKAGSFHVIDRAR